MTKIIGKWLRLTIMILNGMKILLFFFNDEMQGKVKMYTRHLNLQGWIKIDKTYSA